MKSLARRVKGAFAFGAVTTIGIAVTWSQALGQATPDAGRIEVPEPSSVALMIVGVAATAAYHKLRNRK